jgi:hypothetical protein
MTIGGWVISDRKFSMGWWVTGVHPDRFQRHAAGRDRRHLGAFAAFRDAECLRSDADPHSCPACSTGTFSLSTKISLGPDNFPGSRTFGPLRPRAGNPATLGTPTIISDDGSFAFPSTSISALPVSQLFNICNLGAPA